MPKKHPPLTSTPTTVFREKTAPAEPAQLTQKSTNPCYPLERVFLLTALNRLQFIKHSL